MKTKVLFFVLASAFLAMLVMGCEGTVGPSGDDGGRGPQGESGTDGGVSVEVTTLTEFQAAIDNPTVTNITVKGTITLPTDVADIKTVIMIPVGSKLIAAGDLKTTVMFANDGTLEVLGELSTGTKFVSTGKVEVKTLADGYLVLSGVGASLKVDNKELIGVATTANYSLDAAGVVAVTQAAGPLFVYKVTNGTMKANKDVTLTSATDGGVTVGRTATLNLGGYGNVTAAGALAGEADGAKLITTKAISSLAITAAGTYQWFEDVWLAPSDTPEAVRTILEAGKTAIVNKDMSLGTPVNAGANAKIILQGAITFKVDAATSFSNLEIEVGEDATLAIEKAVTANAAGAITGKNGAKLTTTATGTIAVATNNGLANEYEVATSYVYNGSKWVLKAEASTIPTALSKGVTNIDSTGNLTLSAALTIEAGEVVNMGAGNIALATFALTNGGTLNTTGTISTATTGEIKGTGTLTAGAITSNKVTAAKVTATSIKATSENLVVAVGDLTVNGDITGFAAKTVSINGTGAGTTKVTGDITASGTSGAVTVGNDAAGEIDVTGTITGTGAVIVNSVADAAIKTGAITGIGVTIGKTDVAGTIKTGIITAGATGALSVLKEGTIEIESVASALGVIIGEATHTTGDITVGNIVSVDGVSVISAGNIVTGAIAPTNTVAKDVVVTAGDAKKVTTKITTKLAGAVTLKGKPQDGTTINMTGAGKLTYGTLTVGPTGAMFAIAVGDATKALTLTVAAGRPTLTINNTTELAMPASACVIPAGMTLIIKGALKATTDVLTLGAGAVLDATGLVTVSAAKEIAGSIEDSSLAASKLILRGGSVDITPFVVAASTYTWTVDKWVAVEL